MSLLHRVLQGRALGYIAALILGYSMMVQCGCFLFMVTHLHHITPPLDSSTTPLPVWGWASFLTITAFNNVGLTPYTGHPSHQFTGVCMVMALAVTAGHALFPVFIRGSVWALFQLTRDPALQVPGDS